MALFSNGIFNTANNDDSSHVVVERGRSATSQRRMTMHGSSSERRLGEIQRHFEVEAEKPGNRFGGGNRNQDSRGSRGPGGSRP